MSSSRQAVGAYGERCAARHLIDAGLVIIERNWRSVAGEIDIIARQGDTVVFCEVKTRRSTRYGSPEEAVTTAKARRIRRLAAGWLAANPAHHHRTVRFDLVSVLVTGAGAAQVRHLPAVF